MDNLFFLFLLLFLAIIYFIIGYCVSRSIKSIEEYYLASRNLEVFPITVSLIATQLGGGFILGTSEKAWNSGYFGLLYVIGICLGFFMLAFKIAGKLRSFNVSTTAEIFEVAYGSNFLKKIASLCSIFSLCGIFAAQIIASKALLIALKLYNPIFFIIFWILIIFYAMLGGLKAIIKNDIFQLSLIIIVFVTLFIWDFITNKFGLSYHVFTDLSSTKSNINNISQILTIIFLPALYSLIEQDLAQIFFAAKTPKLALKGALYAALFLMFFAFIPLYFGMKTKLLAIPIILQANPLMSYFNLNYNQVIVSLVTYGVLAAIISTANAVLCAVSGNLVQDFNINKLSNNKLGLFIPKFVTLIIGILGLICSFYYTDLIELLVDSYALPVTGLLVPLIYAYFKYNFKDKLDKTAAYFSVFTGLSIYIFLTIINKFIFFNPAFDALILSAIAFSYILFQNRYRFY